MHECPNCGQLTAGAYDDEGTRWLICDDCMQDLEMETERDYTEDR
jgi:hypothetical protein